MSYPFDIRDLQYSINKWRESNSTLKTSEEALIGAFEEMGELSHAHLKCMQGIKDPIEMDVKKKDAIGDIIIFLIHYCNLHGFDLEEIILETWDHVKKRNYNDYIKDNKIHYTKLNHSS